MSRVVKHPLTVSSFIFYDCTHYIGQTWMIMIFFIAVRVDTEKQREVILYHYINHWLACPGVTSLQETQTALAWRHQCRESGKEGKSSWVIIIWKKMN